MLVDRFCVGGGGFRGVLEVEGFGEGVLGIHGVNEGGLEGFGGVGHCVWCFGYGFGEDDLGIEIVS